MCGKPFFLVLIAFGLFISNSNAQTISLDTPIYSNAASRIIDHYNAAIDGQLEIYNGTIYHLWPQVYRGSAYFDEKIHFTPSLIRYNGTWYKDIPVLYDIYTDVMVAAAKDSLFILRADKVSDIYLLDHHFVYIDVKNSANLSAGFYDELYDGKSRVLVKRVRTIENSVTQQTVNIIYENKDVVYVRKGNNYYPVNSKGSVLDVFKDKKKALVQYLNENKIKYKNDREGSIVKLATYYDQINN
ncbi:MAG: hypothetical protein ACXVA2_14455 [Mucilaginibacter sp.]